MKKSEYDAIQFDFDQYRKLMLSKAVCMDHSIMELCFLEGIYNDFLPFLNAVLVSPDKSGEVSHYAHKTKTSYPFLKHVVIKWDQRFPSVSSYMIYPCRGMKMIDIDIEDDTYCDRDQLIEFNEFVDELCRLNRSNETLKRSELKGRFGIVREIGDAIFDTLVHVLDIDETQLYYTGRGFQIWAPYEYSTIQSLMDKGYICSSNDEERKAQRLFSPLFMGIEKSHKGHMQCCVPYSDWNRFKFSNPAFYKIATPELRKLAMEYNNAHLVSKDRQIELELRIYSDLKINIEPILS